MDDSATWTAFRAGSVEAFSGIYRAYFQSLLNYGNKLTHDKSLVEDAIHDLFIDLWSKRDRLKDTSSIKYYLFKCLRRKIIKIISVHFLLAWEEISNRDKNRNYEFTLTAEEKFILDEEIYNQVTQIQQNLIKLTRRQREALYLKFYRGLSTKEIATAMGLTLKSAYNLISKGKISLRVLLGPLEAVHPFRK